MSKKTGGTAFPTQSRLGLNDASTWITEIPGQPGMTLRDYFAAKAMQTILVGVEDKDDMSQAVAETAYKWADAMLKARAE